MMKIILFISAFVPMYILFLLNLIVELINENLTFNITNTVVLILLAVLTLIGTFGLLGIVKQKGEFYKEVKILSKKNLTDQHFLNYFSLFVLLALTFDLSKISFVCVLIAILVFIGIVYIKNNIYYVNPLLNIMGYSFYDITFKSGDKVEELRIFYKGHLDIENKNYQVYIANRNLNFLKSKTKK